MQLFMAHGKQEVFVMAGSFVLKTIKNHTFHSCFDLAYARLLFVLPIWCFQVDFIIIENKKIYLNNFMWPPYNVL